MSEVNNTTSTEELNDDVVLEVDDAEVVTVPIDETLSISGEAADAKVVGDALAQKADRSEVNTISVNGQAADRQGLILLHGGHIPASGTDSETVAAKLTALETGVEALEARTAGDIPMSAADETTVGEKIGTIESSVETIQARTAEDIPMSGTDATSVAEKLEEIEHSVDERTADEIPLSASDETTVAEALAERVKTVNGAGPDGDGGVEISRVALAENLESSLTQTVEGDFAVRSSGGSASITDGDGWLSVIRGGRVHEGYVAEELDMTVTAMEREEGVEPITAAIDRDVFVGYVESSGTITLIYSTGWSADPELYGIHVAGDPVSGDYITVEYVKEERGTIIQSNPQRFVSTGWNLYDNAAGYARVARYSEEYGYRISGAYTTLAFAETEDGTQQAITVVDGNFMVPADGYVFVVGGDSTSTAIWATWSDWTEGYSGSFEAYAASVVDLSAVMARYFPYGLLQVGNLQDEININVGIATSYVTRMAYSAANLEAARATGRAFEYDENYIYIARATAEMYTVSVEGQYAACDHGMEIFEGTETALFARTIYGNNLKNKLERDVLTISAQTLSGAQKAQVQQNLGLNVANNLSTTAAGSVLDARQGKALNDSISSLNDSLANIKFHTGSKSAGSSITITRVSGTVRGFVILTSSNSDNCGMIALAMSSTVAVGRKMIAASNITVAESATSGTITISVASSTTGYTIGIISGEVTVS